MSSNQLISEIPQCAGQFIGTHGGMEDLGVEYLFEVRAGNGCQALMLSCMPIPLPVALRQPVFDQAKASGELDSGFKLQKLLE